MPTLEVQQKFLSILVQFVKYVNFCQLLFWGQVESCYLFKLGITPCKAEQPLKGMGLQEKETQTD